MMSKQTSIFDEERDSDLTKQIVVKDNERDESRKGKNRDKPFKVEHFYINF